MADVSSWGSTPGALIGDQSSGSGGGGPDIGSMLASFGLNQGQQQGIQDQLTPASPLENFGGMPAAGFGLNQNLDPLGSSGGGGILSSLSSLLGGSGLGLAGLGSGIGSDIASLFGNFGGGAGATAAGGEGGQIGGEIGGLAGSALGPLGSLGGGAIGDLLGSLLGSWIGGGVNSMAKPDAVMGALNARGGIDSLLAKYIGSGTQRGYDLSQSGAPYNPGAMASALQLLSGQSLGEGMNGKLGLGNLGFGSPTSLYGISNLPQLQGLFGKGGSFPTLQLSQISQIMPMLSALANRMPGNPGMKGREAYFNKVGDLATKLKNAESY